MRLSKLLGIVVTCLFLTAPVQAATVDMTSMRDSKGPTTVSFVEQKDQSTYLDLVYPQIRGMANLVVQKQINDQIKSRVYELTKKDVFDGDKRSYWTRYEIPYDNSLVSIRLNQSINVPHAAHPANFISSITLDKKTGKELKFADLFKPNVKYQDKVNELARQESKRIGVNLLKPFEGVTANQGFYLTKDALVIYVQEGEYTPHVYGPLVVAIPYATLQDALGVSL